MLIVLSGLVYGRYSGLGEKEPPMNTDYGVELKKSEEKNSKDQKNLMYIDIVLIQVRKLLFILY